MFIFRIGCLVATLIAFVFGLIISKKKKYPKYFNCILYATAALLMSTIYYFGLEADPSFQSLFSLGVFGEITAYLFVFAGNTTLITDKEKQTKFSLTGLIGLIITVAILVVSIFFDSSLGNIITSALMIITAPLTIYTCLRIVENKDKNEFNNKIKGYSIAFIVMAFSSCFIQMMMSLYTANISIEIVAIIIKVTYVVWMLASLASIFVLTLGLKSWNK